MAGIKVFGLVALFTVISTASGANLNITSPPVTDWGVWGTMQRCPFGRYAQGFQLRTEPNQFLGDDTALNTIRIFCGDPFRSDTAVITGSPQGRFGDWGNVYTCYPGVLNGFQLRSESSRGNGDDTAANNIRFYCSNLPDPTTYIEGDGMSWGDWSQAQHCLRNSNQGICAVQTQIEPYMADDGDDSMLNNVRFECCDMNITPEEVAAHPQEEFTTVGDLNIWSPSKVLKVVSADHLQSIVDDKKTAGDKKVEAVKA